MKTQKLNTFTLIELLVVIRYNCYIGVYVIASAE